MQWTQLVVMHYKFSPSDDSKDIKRIACEFNIKPENLISKHFHEGLAYKRVGTQLTEKNTKEVSLMIKEIND